MTALKPYLFRSWTGEAYPVWACELTPETLPELLETLDPKVWRKLHENLSGHEGGNYWVISIDKRTCSIQTDDHRLEPCEQQNE